MADLINPYAPKKEAAPGGGMINPYTAPAPAAPAPAPTFQRDPRLPVPEWVPKTPQQQMTHASDTLQRVARGLDPNVDYETGVPDPTLTAELSLLTKKEQRQLLEKKYGKENVDTDIFGNWTLKPAAFEKAGIRRPGLPYQGPARSEEEARLRRIDQMMHSRPVAVIPKERWTLPRATSFAGEVLPTAGAAVGGTLGAAAGAPAGPGGATAGGIGGAALGAGAGEAGNALIAQMLGIADRTVGEQQRMIAEGMAGGAIGEGLGRGMARIGRAAVGPYAEFAPSSPEHLATLRRTLDMGLIPRMGAAQPKSFLMPREQGLIEAVFGFGPEKKNVEILRKEGEKLVQQTGGRPGAAPADIVTAAQQKIGGMQTEFDVAHRNASKLVDDSIQQLQAKIGKAAPMEVQRDIENAYKASQNEATGLYGEVDKLVGNRPVVPTGPVRKTAQDILDSLPKDRNGMPLYDPDGVAIKFLRGITNLPEMYTMRNMQALRSQLASSAEVRSLLASTGARNAEMLRQASNDAFDQVGQALKGKSGAAVEALRKADKYYTSMMDKFDVPIIRKLTQDARTTGSVPPEKVLEVITMPNAATNVAKIMAVVTPETRNAIRRAHFDSMLEKSSDAITGKISAMQLAQQIKRLKSTFPALYGRDSQSIQTLVNQLAALDGKIDVAALQGGNIPAAIKQAIQAEKALKDVTDDELFAQLAKPGFESATAVDHLFKPNHPERIARALKFFGPDSQEAKNIRAVAMSKLMQAMEFTEETRTGVKHGLSGKQLEDALKMYGRPTIEAMFGKEQTRNLYEFASVAELATAKNPQLSKIAAAALVLHPLGHITKLAELFTMGSLMTSPKFIKWMTEGFKYPPPLARGVNAFNRALAYRQAIQAEQPGIGGDTLVDKELAQARAMVEGGGSPIEARADGGPVEAGKPYLVGERGPEVIVPKSSGEVIPNEDDDSEDDDVPAPKKQIGPRDLTEYLAQQRAARMAPQRYDLSQIPGMTLAQSQRADMPENINLTPMASNYDYVTGNPIFGSPTAPSLYGEDPGFNIPIGQRGQLALNASPGYSSADLTYQLWKRGQLGLYGQAGIDTEGERNAGLFFGGSF